SLVVPQDSALKEPQDFRGKVIATPQLGNTQDVSARAWFSRGGLHVTQRGGDVKILPTPNPEQLSLFRQGKLDGVWTVEPWVSRLVMMAKGKVLVDEKESIATVLVCGSEFLKEKPEVAQAVVKAHEELNQWIRENPKEAQAIVVKELEELTHSRIEPELIARAWKSIHMKDKISIPKLQQFVQDAYHAGFMKEVPDVSGLVTPEAVEEKQLAMKEETQG
ncbi:ABC transporter substrate-binding protein, partial [Akkermansia sp.]